MDYSFSITGLLKEAYNRSEGVKGTIIGAFLIYMIVTVLVTGVLELIFPSGNSIISGLIQTLISAPIIVPIGIGIFFLGINRARGLEIDIPSIFNYYSMIVPITIAFVLIYIALTIGFVLLVIPGIYLLISYSFAYPLLVDKELGPWEAMETSRKIVTKQWFKFFGLAIASTLFLLVSAIPLGIGLIWSIPTVYIAYGLLYHNMFDEEEL